MQKKVFFTDLPTLFFLYRYRKQTISILGLSHCFEITALHQVTGNHLTCPGWDSNPDGGKRQQAVSGKTLDHSVIKVGPYWAHNHFDWSPLKKSKHPEFTLPILGALFLNPCLDLVKHSEELMKWTHVYKQVPYV